MKFEIGTDIVDISRIDSVFKRHSFSFLFRILRPCEIFLTLKSPHYIESNLLESNLLESNKIKSKFIESSLKKYAKFYKDSKSAYFSTKKLENIDSKILAQYNATNKQKSSNIYNIIESFSLDFFKIQTIAGFFSIKEATSKALGMGINSQLSFKDMCIFKDKNGKPHIKINKNKKQLFKIKHISISITHEKSSAVATTLIKLKS